MNVYDFDGTIYHGDSSVDFWLYCSRKKPLVFLRCLPRLSLAAIRFVTGRTTKERWKETFFSFLRYIPADEALLRDFWASHWENIGDWYLKQKQDSDLIISASPVFLLRPASQKLGVSLIATKVDPASGRFDGLNCSGVEKVRRFREVYPSETVDHFYTDSPKDFPMAALAGKSFMVRKGKVRELRDEELRRSQSQ